MTVDDMTEDYLTTLLYEPEPTPRALAMARAILAYVEHLRDDDPGDDEARVRPLIERAACTAVDLVDTMRRMVPIIVLTIAVHSSAPPLAPADAVRVLRASRSIADRTEAKTVQEVGPRLVVITSKPQDGPFGRFPRPRPTAPLSRGPYHFGPRVVVLPVVVEPAITGAISGVLR